MQRLQTMFLIKICIYLLPNRSSTYSTSVFPWGCGFPFSSKDTKTILSIVIIVWCVILFLTSQLSVIEVLPKLITSIPISIISPCFAEFTKVYKRLSISDKLVIRGESFYHDLMKEIIEKPEIKGTGILTAIHISSSI